MLYFDTKYTNKLPINSIKDYKKKLITIIKKIHDGSAKGANMSYWINYLERFNYENYFQKIKKISAFWKRSGVKNVIVIGIGGSYLGIKACLDMLSYNKNFKFNVIFANNFNQNYLNQILKTIANKKFSIVMISKSGGTLEPSIIFELLKNKLEICVKKQQIKNYIVAITSNNSGILNQLAQKNNWPIFDIPNNIGGRYSALTPCGMFLFCLLGFNCKAIIKGAIDAKKLAYSQNFKLNSAFQYASYRNYLYQKKEKSIENFVVYDPNLKMISEVWKQLFGESEGKENKALFPTNCLFTTDLHAIGQYLQEGKKIFFETTLFIKKPLSDIVLCIKNNALNLRYLNKKKLSYINNVAMLSTIKAHFIEGKINNFVIYLDKQDEYHFGYLYIWLCFSAMFSAYLLELNPFDQPGVEIYKKRIISVLKQSK